MISVIFDCDGVLVDSEKLSCGAWLPVLHRRGIKADLADIEVFIGRSEHAVLDHLVGRTALSPGPSPRSHRTCSFPASGEPVKDPLRGTQSSSS